VSRCRVWFDPDTQLGNVATRAAFSLEQHWRAILQVCANHGFEVVGGIPLPTPFWSSWLWKVEL
jgi:hypothetical protein